MIPPKDGGSAILIIHTADCGAKSIKIVGTFGQEPNFFKFLNLVTIAG